MQIMNLKQVVWVAQVIIRTVGCLIIIINHAEIKVQNCLNTQALIAHNAPTVTVQTDWLLVCRLLLFVLLLSFIFAFGLFWKVNAFRAKK